MNSLVVDRVSELLFSCVKKACKGQISICMEFQVGMAITVMFFKNFCFFSSAQWACTMVTCKYNNNNYSNNKYNNNKYINTKIGSQE